MSDLDNNPKPLAEIEIGPSRTDEFLNQHYKKLILIGLILAAGVTGVVIWNHTQKDTARKGARQLSETITEIFKNNTDADEQLARIAKEFNKYPAGETADLVESASLWKQGEREKAITNIKDFIAAHPESPLLTFAEYTLALRLSSTHQWDEAKGIFQKIADSKDQIYSPLALMWLGDIAQTDKDSKKAKEFYEQIKTEYPNSFLVMNSNHIPARLELLNTQAPTHITPPTAIPTVPKFDTKPAEINLPKDGKLELNPSAPKTPGAPAEPVAPTPAPPAPTPAK